MWGAKFCVTRREPFFASFVSLCHSCSPSLILMLFLSHLGRPSPFSLTSREQSLTLQGGLTSTKLQPSLFGMFFCVLDTKARCRPLGEV